MNEQFLKLREELLRSIRGIRGLKREAEDLVQQTFLVAHTKGLLQSNNLTIETLKDIFKNEVARENSKNTYQRKKAEKMFSILKSLRETPQNFYYKLPLKTIIKHMKVPYSKALLLYYFKGFDGYKASKEMGITRAHFFVILQRARNKLKEIINEYCEASVEQ